MIDFIYRKESFFVSDFGVIIYFFKEVLPVWILFVSLSFPLVILYLSKSLFLISRINLMRKTKVVFLVTMFLILFFSFFLQSYFSNIYLNTINSFGEQVTNHKINFDLKNNYSIEMKNLDLGYNFNVSSKKVLVFVMEGVDYDDFISQRYDGDIIDHFGNNYHFFNNYYTQNQDSRTSLTNLLTKTFIPYEAYLHNYGEVYGRVYDQISLVDIFEENEYQTHFLISSVEIPIIASQFDFGSIINLDEFPKEDYNCISHEFQKACEDLVIKNDLIEILGRDEKSFIFQEGVYGHGREFHKKDSTSPYEYFSEYLISVMDSLSKETLNNLTIVLVSDHGSKGLDRIREVGGYHIPLVIFSNKLNYSQIDFPMTHSNFIDILNGIYLPVNETFFVSRTQSSIIGYYDFISKNYAFANYGYSPYIFKKSNDFSFEEVDQKFSIFKKYQKDYFGY